MIKDCIWVVGAAGKLGSALVRILKENTDHKIIATDRNDVDITDIKAVEQSADVYRPTVIINCASLSNVKYCEENMIEAFKINALGARNLASVARGHNAKLIQLSTDDIFDGNEEDVLTEFDMPAPITVYAKSKLAGENFVKELNPRHLIVRSSWVYGAGEGDYFSYVAEKGRKGESFEASSNHISTPTSAKELAAFINSLLDKSEYGVYHASCEGMCSRYDFAKAILKGLGYDENLVKKVDSAHKLSTHLENLMMKMTGFYEMPAWDKALSDYIEEIKEAK